MKEKEPKVSIGLLRLHRILATLMFSFILMVGLHAQERSITGTITDETNNPLPGVNVLVKGTATGTVTDINGKYLIKVPNASAVLLFTYVGYISQEIAVGELSAVDVKLLEDLQQLNEVVVIGYGVQKKKLNTGATLNIGGETIQALKTNSPMEALKGITPGVNITQNNGLPGAGTKVVIRGIGTIGNSRPLFVVDGIVVSDIDYLSPSDVESIDVLKDGASSAIFGSRAANGVVLVTTKKGKHDTKTQVSYDAYYGIQNVYKKPELLNAKQYIEIMDEANENTPNYTPKNAIKWATLVPDYDRIIKGEWNGTNWFDEINNKDAPVQSHAVNINGGSAKSVYTLGASYYEEEAVLGKQTNNTYKRFTLRQNSDNILVERNGHDILVLGENIIFTNTQKPTFRTGSIYWNDLHNMLVSSPLLPMYETVPTGKIAKAYSAGNDTTNYHQAIDWNPDGTNPVAGMEYNGKYNTNSNNAINASAYLDFKPMKALVVRSSYGINNWYGSSRSWTPAYELGPKTLSDKDAVSQNMNNGLTWTWTNTATFSQSFGEHNITAMAGNEMSRTSSKLSLGTSTKNTIFNDAEHAYISNTQVVDPGYSLINGKDEYGDALMSYFGRLSYDFNETYMFTAVLRADGSSHFPLGHRWGTFPSISAGWLVSNEEFMDFTKSWLSSLKVRASWGQNGNQDIERYQYLSNQSYSLANYFFGTDKTLRSVGSYPSRVPNYNLKWETSEQTDLGFDLYAANNKLMVTFDWYSKLTRDWLVKPPVLAEWGTAGPFVNGGDISNKGYEISVRWNDRDGDFRYGATLSLSHNVNKVEKINNEEKIVHGQNNVLSQGTSELYRAQVGYPIGYFWGYKSDGVFQDSAEVEKFTRGKASYYKKDSKTGKMINSLKPGDVRLVDMNGDTAWTDKDKVLIGNPHPDYIVGFQIDAGYKGFYVMATLNGNFGMQVAKSYRSFVDGAKQNYTTDIYNRWHGAGTSTKMPRITQTGTTYISDIYVEDADFVRINNITVGYDFKNLFKELPFGEAKLYFAVKNLHTFTNYSGLDPEVGYAPDSWGSGVDLGLYPLSQSYMVGLSVKF